ncbi:hypothetical protein KAJ87_01500 [Candidatus Pacearchaeota archaeon]|nr:hypothetical protein [Candidatus Pacearchaeota archaeon]
MINEEYFKEKIDKEHISPEDILNSYNPLTKEMIEKGKIWNHVWGQTDWGQESWGREWGKDWGKETWNQAS